MSKAKQLLSKIDETIELLDTPPVVIEEQVPAVNKKDSSSPTCLATCYVKNCKHYNETAEGNCILEKIDIGGKNFCAQFEEK